MAVSAVAASACGAATTTTVLSLRGLDGTTQAAAVAERARRLDGVDAAAFDIRTAELTVEHDPTRAPQAAVAAAVRSEAAKQKPGVGEAVLGGGRGTWAPQPGHPEGADWVTVATGGEDVDVEAHLAPGKVTVVDFYADWCVPCRAVAVDLASQCEARDDLAVRKVDVADWDTPAAKRWLKGVPELPYVRVYRPDGTFHSDLAGLDLAALRAAIAEAAATAAEAAE